MIRRALIALALATVALPAAPASAQSYLDDVRKLTPTARLDGTNGYELTVAAGGDSILLLAERRNVRVSYLSSDEQSDTNHLIGSFGTAGSIRMEFAGRGRPRRHRVEGCDGTYTTRRGVWRGSIAFLGKGGFTSVAATKARGRTVTRSDIDCGSDEEKSGGDGRRQRHGFFVDAISEDEAAASIVGVSVHWLNGRRRAEVSAFTEEIEGPVSIEFEVIRSAPRNRVHLSIRRGRARIAPGYPFVGSAKFRASDHDVNLTHGIPVEPGPTWEGNLAVVMPGHGLVPLTGPGFKPGAGSLTVIAVERRSPFGAVRPPLAP